MTTYIAQFTAEHRLLKTMQNSIFIWRQESGEIDQTLLANKIKRESALPFYTLIAAEGEVIVGEDISVNIYKAMPFPG